MNLAVVRVFRHNTWRVMRQLLCLARVFLDALNFGSAVDHHSIKPLIYMVMSSNDQKQMSRFMKSSRQPLQIICLCHQISITLNELSASLQYLIGALCGCVGVGGCVGVCMGVCARE